MSSLRYQLLKKRQAFLAKTFLPAAIRPDGNYSAVEMAKADSLMVFLHAELEAYFESSATHLVERALSRWRNRRLASIPLVSLACYKSGKEITLADDIFDQSPPKRLDSVVYKAATDHENRIKSNNGVRKKNISCLFIPLGIRPDDINADLIDSLDAFGSRRGDIVHNTIKKRSKIKYDPFVEVKEISEIIDNIDDFDKIIIKYAK